MPRQLERRQRIGDLLAPAELERGAERVPEREPEDAAHHPFPQVIHGVRSLPSRSAARPLVA